MKHKPRWERGGTTIGDSGICGSLGEGRGGGLGVHVGDQATAEGGRVGQRGRRLLVEHADKHACHHQLVLPPQRRL